MCHDLCTKISTITVAHLKPRLQNKLNLYSVMGKMKTELALEQYLSSQNRYLEDLYKGKR